MLRVHRGRAFLATLSISALAAAGSIGLSSGTLAGAADAPDQDPPEGPETVQTPPPPPAVTSQTVRDVTDEASYRDAILDLSADPSGPHTINVLADITLTGNTDPEYTGDQDLTVNGNGHTIDGGGTVKILDSDGPANLTINDLTVVNGTDTNDSDGGGIEGEATVTVNRSTFRDNHADQDEGGAVDADNIRVTDTTFEGNTASDQGGALKSEEDGPGTGTIDVDPSVFTGNHAGSDGGAIDSDEALTITNSTFSENASDGDGGAVDTSDEAAALTVTGSTFAGNTATEDGSAMEAEGVVNVTNSTITANQTTATDGTTDGGAINSEVGDVTLTYVTMAGNIANAGVAEDVRAFDNSIEPAGPGTLTSFGTVIAGAQCDLNGGTTSSSYSYETGSSCGFTGTGDTQNGADPLLGALGDNGGPTPTMLPQSGSPLIDAIPVAACDPTVTVDQRGVTRPQQNGCDIGAVEVEAPPPAPITVTPTFTG